MSVLAYRSGVLAADRLLTCNEVVAGEARKVGKRKSDGTLIGVAGNWPQARAVLMWFLDGEKDDRKPSFGDEKHNCVALVIRPKGIVERHDRHGIEIVDGEYTAEGTGWTLAMTAMDAGLDAPEAVRLACLRDIYSGGAVEYVVAHGVAHGVAKRHANDDRREQRDPRSMWRKLRQSGLGLGGAAQEVTPEPQEVD